MSENKQSISIGILLSIKKLFEIIYWLLSLILLALLIILFKYQYIYQTAIFVLLFTYISFYIYRKETKSIFDKLKNSTLSF